MRRLFLLSLIGSFFFMVTYPVTAKEEASRLRISHSKVSSLLRQQTITTVKRDTTGFLWIGTQQGLFKYDGEQLVVFSSDQQGKNEVPSSDIQQIEIGPNGEIWIATFGGGIAKYDANKESFWPVFQKEFGENIFVTTMLSTDDGNIWFGTRDAGIFSFKSETGQRNTWLDDHPMNSHILQSTDILQDSAKNIWVGSATGLYKINPVLKNIESYPLPRSVINGDTIVAIKSLQLAPDGSMWVGTESGALYQFDFDSKSFVMPESIQRFDLGAVEDISICYGKIWAATDLGLFAIDVNTAEVTTFSQKNSFLSNDHVTSLYFDGEILWVGTYFGLNLVSKTSFETFNFENSGVANEVLSFSSDNSGRTWVATYDGIYFIHSGTNQHQSLHSLRPEVNIVDQRIMSVATEGNNLWLGFRHNGIQIIDLTSGHSTSPKLPLRPDFAITKILHTSDDTTWVGTYFNGLFSIKNGIVTSYYITDSDVQSSKQLQERSITALFEAHDRQLLIGTEGGAFKFSRVSGDFTPIKIDTADGRTPTVLSISENNDANIWIGTKDHGFFFQTDSDFFHSNNAHSTIYGIEFDSINHAWISTAGGLIEIGQEGHMIRRFSTADGLQGNDFNFGASHKDSKGRLYFGGSNGYNRFDPEDVNVESPPPPVVLTGVEIAGREPELPVALRDLELIELSHSDYYITLIFSALDFIDPAKNQFSYKLENFDPEWIDNSTRNSATYTNLPAGEYVFTVRGANSVGVWNMEGASIRIRVLPAPWLTWWAYLGYALVALVILLALKRVYDNHLITRKATIMAQDMSNAADRANDDLQEQLEIQDELVRSVYRHNVDTLELFERITSLQSELSNDTMLRRAIAGNPGRLLALTHLQRYMFYHGEALFADLNKYADSIIGLLLKSSPVPAESIVTVNEIGNRLVPISVATPLALIAFELLHNSINHAFGEGSAANFLQISLAEDITGQLLTLAVTDSGSGLPENLHSFENNVSGLSIVGMITDLIEGTVEFTSTGGTTISITIPIEGGLLTPLFGLQSFQV
jgi:ligand-binding sensor domain-containing protein/two-component sensor histidine kinase